MFLYILSANAIVSPMDKLKFGNLLFSRLNSLFKSSLVNLTLSLIITICGWNSTFPYKLFKPIVNDPSTFLLV